MLFLTTSMINCQQQLERLLIGRLLMRVNSFSLSTMMVVWMPLYL
nr:MAG TPA: hypothetical protein [Caudoviricetes sp.]